MGQDAAEVRGLARRRTWAARFLSGAFPVTAFLLPPLAGAGAAGTAAVAPMPRPDDAGSTGALCARQTAGFLIAPGRVAALSGIVGARTAQATPASDSRATDSPAMPPCA